MSVIFYENIIIRGFVISVSKFGVLIILIGVGY